MIANARMYSVSAEAGAVWRELLSGIIAKSGVPATLFDHPAPAPLEQLWSRSDQAAVFMCGLPYSRAEPQPILVAAPIPAPAEFQGAPWYWSEFVVRKDGPLHTMQDAFGSRLALTVPDSQSGCLAALTHLMAAHRGMQAPAGAQGEIPGPLFQEIIAPTVTPVGALTAVVQGAADVAPIDSYALRLLRKYRPDLASAVRVVGRTAPTPIPPLVASPGAMSDEELAALRTAFLEAHLSPTLRRPMNELLLERFDLPLPGAYAVLRADFEAAMRHWSMHHLAEVYDPAFQPLKR